MRRRHFIGSLIAAPVLLSAPAALANSPYRFDSIDGGEYDLRDWRGAPVLVVNTASLCAFTPQFGRLQELHEAYANRGLVVLAVPSNTFAQELTTNEAVQSYCEANFSLTLPMTVITDVRGPDAHPFFEWVRQETRFVPAWNFNKVLLDGEGNIVDTYSSVVDPMGRRLTSVIEELLPQ